MKRDVVITVLLVLAGIILAIVLFGAGVFWRGKTSPARSSQMVPAQHQIDKQVQTTCQRRCKNLHRAG